MVDYSYLLDYERHEKSRFVELRCLDGLICPIAACGTYYTAGETPALVRPRWRVVSTVKVRAGVIP